MNVKDFSIGNKLKLQRISKGYSVDELGKRIGVNGSTISRWENGRLDKMGRRYIALISKELDISPLIILGMDDKKHEDKTDKDECSMLEKYRLLDFHGREIVDSVLNIEFNQIKSKAIDNVRYVNYYRTPSSAGPGQILFDSIDIEQITIPDKPEYKRVSYAVSVRGDSMEPDYQDDDIILIEPTTDLQIGEIGIFYVDGSSYLKKLGTGELISLNTAYEPIRLNEDSRCMGRVIGKL